MHENGNWYTEGNVIKNHYNKDIAITDFISMVFDADTGTMLHVNAKEEAERYFATTVNAYSKSSFGDAMDIRIATIDMRGDSTDIGDHKLTADEACTLVNYLSNHIDGKKIIETLNMGEYLKARIAEVARYGF